MGRSLVAVLHVVCYHPTDVVLFKEIMDVLEMACDAVISWPIDVAKKPYNHSVVKNNKGEQDGPYNANS